MKITVENLSSFLLTEEELMKIIEKCRWGQFAEHISRKPDFLEYPKKIAQAIHAAQIEKLNKTG